MKEVKSIFDKSYIVEAQAIKAGEKEWPQGHANIAALSFDTATKKYRWVTSITADYGPSDLDVANAAVENLTFAQALAESGESLDDLKDGDAKANATMAPAFVMPTHCPHCNIGLDNGISAHGDVVNLTPMMHEKYEYACLGCGEEFGPAIGVKKERPRLSSCIRPTKLVWDIADVMPKASRKEVMEECVRQGVAYGTARTQYQAWFKASQEIERLDVRRPYEKGDK